MSAAPDRPPMISVQDLWKSFGDNHVLTGIDLGYLSLVRSAGS